MKQIFINLPIKDLEASMNFYTALGFTLNPLFTFDDQKCMVWSEQIYVMLQSFEMFKSNNLSIPGDSEISRTATFTLLVENLNTLNKMVENALMAGGTELSEVIDEGFMKLRNIQDLDGHHWAIICLDLEKFKEMTGRGL